MAQKTIAEPKRVKKPDQFMRPFMFNKVQK